MKAWMGAVAAAVVMAAAGAAQAAEPLPEGGVTQQDIVGWLQEAGYKAVARTANDGSLEVTSASDGVNFTIRLYDCSDGRCASIQFYCSFDVKEGLGLDTINEWNKTKRFVRGYLDSEDDPWFEYDASVSPGGTVEALNDDFAVWRSFLPLMKKHIGW